MKIRMNDIYTIWIDFDGGTKKDWRKQAAILEKIKEMIKSGDVYTVRIDFEGVPDYETRAKYAVKAILLPYKFISVLKTEFASWKANNTFEKPIHKVYYILDHFILFPYYCIKAIFVGVVSKKRWKMSS